MLHPSIVRTVKPTLKMPLHSKGDDWSKHVPHNVAKYEALADLQEFQMTHMAAGLGSDSQANGLLAKCARAWMVLGGNSNLKQWLASLGAASQSQRMALASAEEKMKPCRAPANHDRTLMNLVLSTPHAHCKVHHPTLMLE